MNRGKQVGRAAGRDGLTIAATSAFDAAREERSRVADEIAGRLRKNGVRLFGDESLEELADLLEAVEQFEAAVDARGGDLMVDEPINGVEPIAPDAAEYLLPLRGRRESVASFLARVDQATNALRHPGRNR